MAARFSKVRDVVAGGSTRAESVYRGIQAVPRSCKVVLVHDAARPVVRPALIDRVLEGVWRWGAAVPGLAISDTVKRVDEEGRIRSTVPRTETLGGQAVAAGLMAVQTPQGAMLELLAQAFEVHGADLDLPDEASLLERSGHPVGVVAGDPDNIKVTRPDDLVRAERLLAEQDAPAARDGEIRTGLGYDVHVFAHPGESRPLMLGGIHVPHDRGLSGHSDADVLLHAVCDALLGAAALGDIGVLFPNTDEAYRGIASLRLLEAVRDRVASDGWRVLNVDATLLAEAPKVMPHRDAIRASIASALRVAADRVSVKATTSEGMGFVGRREGMACWATATLRREHA